MKATETLHYQWHPPEQRVARAPGDPYGVLLAEMPPIAHVTTDPVTLGLHVTDFHRRGLSVGDPSSSAVLVHLSSIHASRSAARTLARTC